MKAVICGCKNYSDYDELCEIITNAQNQFGTITHIMSFGEKSGTDSLVEKYALENNIKITIHKPDWNNVKCAGAVVKQNINPFTKKKQKYNSVAAFQRNEQVIGSADILIIVNHDSLQTKNLIKLAKRNNVNIFFNYKTEINHKYNIDIEFEDIPF